MLEPKVLFNHFMSILNLQFSAPLKSMFIQPAVTSMLEPKVLFNHFMTILNLQFSSQLSGCFSNAKKKKKTLVSSTILPYGCWWDGFIPFQKKWVRSETQTVSSRIRNQVAEIIFFNDCFSNKCIIF